MNSPGPSQAQLPAPRQLLLTAARPRCPAGGPAGGGARQLRRPPLRNARPPRRGRLGMGRGYLAHRRLTAPRPGGPTGPRPSPTAPEGPRPSPQHGDKARHLPPAADPRRRAASATPGRARRRRQPALPAPPRPHRRRRPHLPLRSVPRRAAAAAERSPHRAAEPPRSAPWGQRANPGAAPPGPAPPIAARRPHRVPAPRPRPAGASGDRPPPTVAAAGGAWTGDPRAPRTPGRRPRRRALPLPPSSKRRQHERARGCRRRGTTSLRLERVTAETLPGEAW